MPTQTIEKQDQIVRANPVVISLSEWQEIIKLPIVKENWGLTDETPEEFASQVYAVKFDFMSGSPGYCGDLYIIQGDVLTGDAPLMLIRLNGVLQTAYD